MFSYFFLHFNATKIFCITDTSSSTTDDSTWSSFEFSDENLDPNVTKKIKLRGGIIESKNGVAKKYVVGAVREAKKRPMIEPVQSVGKPKTQRLAQVMFGVDMNDSESSESPSDESNTSQNLSSSVGVLAISTQYAADQTDKADGSQYDDTQPTAELLATSDQFTADQSDRHSDIADCTESGGKDSQPPADLLAASHQPGVDQINEAHGTQQGGNQLVEPNVAPQSVLSELCDAHMVNIGLNLDEDAMATIADNLLGDYDLQAYGMDPTNASQPGNYPFLCLDARNCKFFYKMFIIIKYLATQFPWMQRSFDGTGFSDAKPPMIGTDPFFGMRPAFCSTPLPSSSSTQYPLAGGQSGGYSFLGESNFLPNSLI